MTDKILIEAIAINRQQNTLDHKWLIRMYLSKNTLISSYLNQTSPDLVDDLIIRDQIKYKSRSFDQVQSDDFIILLKEALSPFEYLSDNKSKIETDQSLNAITKLCTNSDLIYDIGYEDSTLSKLAQMFNDLVNSNRSLHLCYDCGTVARGMFFSLIKVYRGSFDLSKTEIDRITRDYRMDRFTPQKSLQIMKQNFAQIQQSCLYLCALQFGEKFGHIYIIEKRYHGKNPKPTYRLFQSCFNSYMLIDEIEYQDFANGNGAIDIHEYENDMAILMQVKDWDQMTIETFCKWFHFYPSSRIFKSDVKKISTTYVIY